MKGAFIFDFDPWGALRRDNKCKKKAFATLVLPSIPRPMSQTFVTIGSVKGTDCFILNRPIIFTASFSLHILDIFFVYSTHILGSFWHTFAYFRPVELGGLKKVQKVQKKPFATLVLPSILRQMSQTFVTIGSLKEGGRIKGH